MSLSKIPQSANIFDEIVSALGTRNKFSEPAKRRFAEAIMGHLLFSRIEEETILFDKGHTLLQSIKVLEGAVQDFHKIVLNSWEGSNAYQLVKGKIETDFSKEPLLDLLALLTKELKPRIANKAYGKYARELSIAQMIAHEYKKCLKRDPATGGDKVIELIRTGERKKKQTPYDKVCVIIGKIYSPTGKITFATRGKAIERAKQGWGMRPKTTP